MRWYYKLDHKHCPGNEQADTIRLIARRGAVRKVVINNLLMRKNIAQGRSRALSYEIRSKAGKLRLSGWAARRAERNASDKKKHSQPRHVSGFKRLAVCLS